MSNLVSYTYEEFKHKNNKLKDGGKWNTPSYTMVDISLGNSSCKLIQIGHNGKKSSDGYQAKIEQVVAEVMKGTFSITNPSTLQKWSGWKSTDDTKSLKSLYVVSAVMNKDNESDEPDSSGVQIAGLFSTQGKADKARGIVEEWMEREGFDDSAVFVSQMKIDKLGWYDIEMQL